MYDEESLESAVQSVWELAMALATLKHIATGYTAETKIKTTDEVNVTNCEKTESGDMVSSLTLNIVCQQNKSNDKSMSTDSILENNMETKQQEKLISSMTGHTQEAAHTDLCSMATHENTSNIVHQVTKEDRTAAGTYRSSLQGLYEPQVSMAAHYPTYPDSMLCQETGPDCSIAQQMVEAEMCSEFLPSMVAHQVTVADIPLEYADTPVSMVPHVILRDKECLMEKDTITSMKVHQLSIPEKLEMESLQNASSTKESLLYTNSQLSYMETNNRVQKYFPPHKHETVEYGLEKTDKNNFIPSLSSHQASFTPSEDSYTSLASHQDMTQSQEDMNSFVSMAAHIAGSKYTPDIITNKHERKTSSKKDSKVTNLFTVSKIENAGQISDETSKTEMDGRNICSSKKYDRTNDSLQIIEENESLLESENKTKFTKLNTIEETTETHNMTNLKGVEIKSCIVLHQHLNDKENFESKPSMNNNMQCANPVFENSDVANLITASCTIEDNRPVITETLNHNKDIEPESENYKKNNQSASKNNRKEKGIKDTDKNRPELKAKAKGSEIRNSEVSKRSAWKKTTESLTLNGNSKKQYYKIRFKVKLGEDPSKPSALKYLFEYLGGQN
jgi:hypothetical protein